jgi:arylsulfatase
MATPSAWSSVLPWPERKLEKVPHRNLFGETNATAGALAAMVGLTPPPHDWVGDDAEVIYFDSIDNSAYILGKSRTPRV